MKKLIYLLMTVTLSVSAVSCQKDITKGGLKGTVWYYHVKDYDFDDNDNEIEYDIIQSISFDNDGNGCHYSYDNTKSDNTKSHHEADGTYEVVNSSRITFDMQYDIVIGGGSGVSTNVFKEAVVKGKKMMVTSRFTNGWTSEISIVEEIYTKDRIPAAE